MTKKYFNRCKEIFKNTGFRYILATISAFSIIYLVKYFLDLFLSGYITWGGVLVVIGGVGYLYNDMCQAKGYDIKNAILSDWTEIPIIVHLIIIIFAPLFILLHKFILSLIEKNGEGIKNIKHIAYGR